MVLTTVVTTASAFDQESDESLAPRPGTASTTVSAGRRAYPPGRLRGHRRRLHGGDPGPGRECRGGSRGDRGRRSGRGALGGGSRAPRRACLRRGRPASHQGERAGRGGRGGTRAAGRRPAHGGGR